MRSFQLFDLPAHLSGQLLGSWLSLKDLTALDKAQCNRATRTTYLEVLKSDGCVMDLGSYECLREKLLDWVLARRIKAHRVSFHYNTGRFPDTDTVFLFMCCVGKTLLDLTATNDWSHAHPELDFESEHDSLLDEDEDEYSDADEEEYSDEDCSEDGSRRSGDEDAEAQDASGPDDGASEHEDYVAGPVEDESGPEEESSCSVGTFDSIRSTDKQSCLCRISRHIYAKCPNLQVLEYKYCDYTSGRMIGSLLASKASSLQRLALDGDGFIDELRAQVEMVKLQYVRFVQSTLECSVKLCAWIGKCRSLLYFSCDNFSDAEPFLHALAQSCPHLASLHDGYEQGIANTCTTAGLEAVLLACKELHTVNFTSFQGFTNAHVTSVVQHCRKLKGLRLMIDWHGISEECIAILRPRLPKLEHLSLVNLRCSSEASLQCLAEHCSQLRTLGLRSIQCAPTVAPLVALLSALPLLEDLDLSDFSDMNDAVLTAIGRTCAKLHTLRLFGTGRLTQKGIKAVIRGCAGMKCVTISPGDGVRHGTLLGAWQVLWSNLQFFCHEDNPTRWEDIRLDV